MQVSLHQKENIMKEIIQIFFRLGIFAFGGPAAHIAMMQREIVEHRKWMSEDDFLDLIGATSLIPGPNSTEMVMHCGMHRKGFYGLVAAGLSFIVPACLMTGLLAYIYTKAIEISPENILPYFNGLYPAVFVLIVLAVKKLFKKAVKNKTHILVMTLVIGLCLFNFSEFSTLLLGGLVGFIISKQKLIKKHHSIEPFSLFVVFAKIGSILFGSGYVLIAYMQSEFVVNRGWLTEQQLIDAIAFGQLTPGPVLSTATFAGYLISGFWGAVWASFGIFLPSFLFVYLLHPFIPKMRASKNFGLFLDSINASAIGLMIYVLLPIGKTIVYSNLAIMTLLLIALIIWQIPKTSSIKIVVISFIMHTILKLSFN